MDGGVRVSTPAGPHTAGVVSHVERGESRPEQDNSCVEAPLNVQSWWIHVNALNAAGGEAEVSVIVSNVFNNYNYYYYYY